MKNKTKKVALYDPYLDTLGGGEKHIFSILEVFAEQGYEINIFWDRDLTEEIKERFKLNKIGKLKWLPNVFKKPSALQTLKTLQAFDCFFYITDGSYFFSGAKKNFVFCMVPDKRLYNLNLLNRFKLWNYIFISNSSFTSRWLKSWGINSITIPPYVSADLMSKKNNFEKKEKIILSVGRFFSHLHSKKQDEMIKTFKKLKLSNPKFEKYKLILAGGLKKEDQGYFKYLKELAGNDFSIIFKPNILLDELHELYGNSNYYWHFAGLGADENLHPEQLEHFGIAPIEAMTSGCLTFSYNAGGPKEITIEGENGFLFNSTDELIRKMAKIENSPELKNKVRLKSFLFIKKNFSYEVFKEKVSELLIKK